MARAWGYLLLCFLSLELCINAAKLLQAVELSIRSRQKLLANRHQLRHEVCEANRPQQIRLFWQAADQWIDVCQTSKATGQLPRLWRIEYTYNYRMIFLPELPITIAIVIKH